MEAVVYDIPSRKLLFRAPGASQVEASATMVNIREKLRADSSRGFGLATEDLARNLANELAAFKERLTTSPGEAQIEHRTGYGGGYVEGWFLLAFGVLCAAAWMRRGKRG